MGDPVNVRVGPGRLFLAPLGTAEPTDLSTPWGQDWVELGYTDVGTVFQFNNTFEDVMVAEELEAIRTLQTARQINITFALAEITAQNMQRAFNGGTVDTAGGVVTFEPPDAGDYTSVMIGWESDDGLERWVFRNCTNTGTIDMARQKAPAKATIPVSFRVNKPANDEEGDSVPSFAFMHSQNYAEVGS